MPPARRSAKGRADEPLAGVRVEARTDEGTDRDATAAVRDDRPAGVSPDDRPAGTVRQDRDDDERDERPVERPRASVPRPAAGPLTPDAPPRATAVTEPVVAGTPVPVAVRPDVTRLVTATTDGAPTADLGVLASTAGVTTVVIDRDVFEEFTYPGSKRTGRRRLYYKGQTVARVEIDARIAAIEAGGGTVR